MINWVSNSNNDPATMERKLLKLLSLPLPAPSAIFEGIDIADLVIWEVNEYFSFEGKAATNFYISCTTCILSIQISYFLKFLNIS